jgi:acyl-CoA thioester hydrolase
MSVDILDRPYRGGFVGPEHHFALTVYFEDTDAAGMVYHANFIKFLERARSDMLQAAGADHIALCLSGGGTYVVAEVHIRYLKPARLGDDLLILSKNGRAARGIGRDSATGHA